jgi:hypothetical protein
MRNTFLLIIILFTISACNNTTDPYDDCILENIKPNLSDNALTMIAQACAGKFIKVKEEECVERDMTKTELEGLQIYSEIGNIPNYLKFSVHNGNTNAPLSEFKIAISADNFISPQIYRVKTKYKLEPEQAQDDIGLTVATTPKGKWNFSLLSATTCSR